MSGNPYGNPYLEDFEDCNISPRVAKIILGFYGLCAIGVFYNVINMLLLE